MKGWSQISARKWTECEGFEIHFLNSSLSFTSLKWSKLALIKLIFVNWIEVDFINYSKPSFSSIKKDKSPHEESWDFGMDFSNFLSKSIIEFSKYKCLIHLRIILMEILTFVKSSIFGPLNKILTPVLPSLVLINIKVLFLC